MPILAIATTMSNADFIPSQTPSEPRTFESLFYSPSSIVSIFNAATVTKEEKKLIQVKGIFRKSGKDNYNGFYYNTLKDEAADYSITLITPVLWHSKLDDNKTIEFNGFITRKLNKTGKIEIHINLVELLAEKTNKFSEEETKRILLINQKIEIGFKDLDAHIKAKIFNNEKLAIKVIMGKSAIIDSDIRKGMQSALSLFDIEYHRVSLSAPGEISSKIKSLDVDGTDIICVARGGGENLEIFDDHNLCNSILNCKTIIASAIGHAENVTLFEKLSDKKFITPTQFGNYLKEIYDHTIEEFQRSKAKLVNDVTQQLSANFNKQIQNLQEQLKLSKELHEKTKADLDKTYSEKLNAANTQLKNFQELASKTANDKASIYQREAESLKTQVNSLSRQLSVQDDLLQQTKNMAFAYQRKLREEKSKAGTFIAIIIIALIIGLFVGVMLARR
jgi:exodeoxyribonuclease VII large subunit